METSRETGGPYLHYETASGRAWCGDSRDLLPNLPDNSINLICTSPPFALTRRKAYGNRHQEDYIKWFVGFARHFKRVLTTDGSLVIDIGGAWIHGSPTRSIYHFELLVTLVRDLGFHLAEEFYWYNRAKLPTPAQWVTIERIRVKDAVNPIWWLSKTERPNASNLRVLKPYSEQHRKLIAGAGYNSGKRPSGHRISTDFGKDNGGAIPPNLIEAANTSSNDPYDHFCKANGISKHPARFPKEVPEFFIKFLTEPGHLVLDPFAGSNMTGAVAEELGRNWLAFERDSDYLDGSLGRFLEASDLDDDPINPDTIDIPDRWLKLPL